VLTGVIFGLGLSEIVLILVFTVLILGPKRISTIKPFLKVAYKNYLRYMREVNSMQGEMEEMKRTIMEPIEEVEREAAQELREVEREAAQGIEGAEDVKKGLKELVRRSKKEMEEARAQAKMEKAKKAGKGGAPTRAQGRLRQNPRLQAQNQMNATHLSRGSHVGLLGKQAPGASRRAPAQKGGAKVSLASALEPKDMKKLYGSDQEQRRRFGQRGQMPERPGFSQRRGPAQRRSSWFQRPKPQARGPQQSVEPTKPPEPKPEKATKAQVIEKEPKPEKAVEKPQKQASPRKHKPEKKKKKAKKKSKKKKSKKRGR
jgi:Sec-independent protein translocase protein TatA